MSNMFNRTNVTYFQIPQFVIDLGLIWKTSASGLRLYLAILSEVQRLSKHTVALKNECLAMSSQTIAKARKELGEWGMILFNRGLGGVYIYTICGDVVTREPPRLVNDDTIGSRSQPGYARTVERSVGLAEVLDGLPLIVKLNFYSERLSQDRRARTTGGYLAICPFHDDSVASLKIDESAGVWYCHGCKQGGGLVDFQRLLKGSTKSAAAKSLVELLAPHAAASQSRAEAIYDYTDETGALLSQVLRYANKRFKVRHMDEEGRWVWNKKGVRDVPYRLHELEAAKNVCITEGEKDADRLTIAFAFSKTEAAVTTSAHGAGHWPQDFGRYFARKDVVILADNDEPGLRHARDVIKSVAQYANATKLVVLPDLSEGEDVSDYLDRHTTEKLLAEIVRVEWTYPEEV